MAADSLRAVLVGLGVLLAGTLPRNALFWANLNFYPALPWAAAPMVLYLWLFWRYLGGAGPPASTADARRTGLRANLLPMRSGPSRS